MDKVASYCCFWCPKGDFEKKPLSTLCPTCQRAYGFPLEKHPATIGEYRVLRPLQRGFYGATYVVEHTGPLRTKHAIKLIPVDLYNFFKKDFVAECSVHSQIAADADHVVGITSLFDADVDFAGNVLRCHAAVLDYLDGHLLGDYLSGQEQLTASIAAQVAADLFLMKDELERHLKNHNDLHADNIIVQRLSKGQLRQGAMDPGVRAVAIDLGSISDDRRSGGKYLGDLHWIGMHIKAMVDVLLKDLDTVSDLDSRVAQALQLIGQIVSPAIESQRTPSAVDFVRLIEREYFRTAEPWRPWREQLRLRTFGSSYNAQTLDAWHIPQLLVDPDGTWLARISAPGPLIITGMRGCGKTLLLRALQFHARAARLGSEADTDVLRRLERDNYVGLFASAQRLLEVDNLAETPTPRVFARLYVAYALEAARALAHLQDIDGSKVSQLGYREIANAVTDALHPKPEQPDLSTVEQLERHLGNLLIIVSRRESEYELNSHPTIAFPLLAQAIRRCSSLWASAQVLFLLDDVSTRYMSADRIEGILSALIYQHPDCAFKITSEAQTIFLSLKSPGQINPAAPGRDFETFDLGADVYDRLREHRKGKQLVEEILQQRARFYSNHPDLKPSQVLGDVTYQQIAADIASSSPESGDRKRVYRGITALTGVCVGDIGSVISLYEDILRRTSKKFPVADQLQTDAYQDFCSRHLYLLDRRGGDLKDVAKSFAEAAHELLMQSARKGPKQRLRQYTSIYVRVTTGDLDGQLKRLRELVDAGVFVFTGGAARTKTRDSNPTQQFKLIYRKIYGLVNFIGLSGRDRFELSGQNLIDWLQKPEEGKQILMRSLAATEEPDGDASLEEPNPAIVEERPTASTTILQESLFTASTSTSRDETRSSVPSDDLLSSTHIPLPKASLIELADIPAGSIDTLVLGLGFEDRTAASARTILNAVNPKQVVAVSYSERGKTDEILALIEKRKIPVSTVSYTNLRDASTPEVGHKSLIDITGLAKPAIFKTVREALRTSSKVFVVYTAAEKYYPLDADLERVLRAEETSNHHALLHSLKDVLMGERPPYKLIPLLPVESDGTRLRGLCAFASSKHERLLHLVDERNYDWMDILVDIAENHRSRIAEIAAEVAIRENQYATISKLPYQDLSKLIEVLGQRYELWFQRGGSNFEIGLTGNKLQAVAAAALSSAVRVNQVWYVSPAEFDPQRFTAGVADTRCYCIEVTRGDPL